MSDPCEAGYVQVGTKEQDGQTVPNCVPEEDVAEPRQQEDGPECEDGYVLVGEKCVKKTTVDDVPPSSLSEPKFLKRGPTLDSEPIEREELEGEKVAYKNIQLLSEGVWTDDASKTPTLYDEKTFENTEVDGSGDGPPVNIAHDLYKEGEKKGEPHEASIGGYIEPDSLRTDGHGLYGNIILDRDIDAGAYADTNLKSALEKGGIVGFSPSVELQPTELEKIDHPQAQEHAKGVVLTGVGLVRDPASKESDMAVQTRQRAVAMSAEGANAYTLQEVNTDMTAFDTKGLAEELELEEDEMESLLAEYQKESNDEEEDEEEEPEMAEEDYEDEEEEEEQEMQETDEEMMEVIAELRQRVETLEDEHAELLNEAATEEDVEALADAETVEEVEARLSEVETTTKELAEQPDPESRKSLADAETDVFSGGRRMAGTDSTGTTSR